MLFVSNQRYFFTVMFFFLAQQMQLHSSSFPALIEQLNNRGYFFELNKLLMASYYHNPNRQKVKYLFLAVLSESSEIITKNWRHKDLTCLKKKKKKAWLITLTSSALQFTSSLLSGENWLAPSRVFVCFTFMTLSNLVISHELWAWVILVLLGTIRTVAAPPQSAHLHLYIYLIQGIELLTWQRG